jgi:4a-hydroxytetrahydrobiopterin dehydratase
MDDLTQKKCEPCESGVPPLTSEQVREYAEQIDSAWRSSNNNFIQRELKFTDFKAALAFVNRVGELAESEGHHPDITIVWNKVTLKLTTHNIGGLSPNDFILAAKVDRLLTDKKHTRAEA